MSTDVAALVNDTFDVWISATERKSSPGRGRGRGRGRGKKPSLYGIEQLRALILDLAMRGKLVPQDAAEEPATLLLSKMTAERLRRIKSGEIKGAQGPSKPSSEPYAVPSGWAWIPLWKTGNIFTGNSISASLRSELEKNKSGRPFVATKDVGYGLESIDYDNGLVVSLDDQRFSVAKPHTVFICAEGGSAGRKMAVSDREVSFGNKLIANEPWSQIEPRFILYTYLSDFFFECFSKEMTGIIGGISRAKFLALPFPLPPLAEQKRIVAKVDELMALCDALEAQSASALEAHQTLVETLLATLVNASDSTDLARQWARLESHFDTLFNTDASVEALKQTVLELAVRGRLVPPDDADEPAGELIRRWEIAKDRALKRGGDRRVKSAPNPTNPPFPIPAHWSVQSFENIFLFVDYRGNTPPKTATGIPLITAKNVRMGYLDREPREYISEATFAEWMTRGNPEIGDLFFTTEAPLGNICLNDIEEPFAIAQRLICLKPYGIANTRFYMMTIMSRSMQRVLDDSATGMTARGIKAAKLKPIALPVPPDAEQQRIVAKVDELMSLCDALKARLATAAQTCAHLADAIVDRAAA